LSAFERIKVSGNGELDRPYHLPKFNLPLHSFQFIVYCDKLMVSCLVCICFPWQVLLSSVCVNWAMLQTNFQKTVWLKEATTRYSLAWLANFILGSSDEDFHGPICYKSTIMHLVRCNCFHFFGNKFFFLTHTYILGIIIIIIYLKFMSYSEKSYSHHSIL
jgi:hypothetical protein